MSIEYTGVPSAVAAIEELDGAVPRGGRRVDLVAATEALDDRRAAPLDLADADEQVFVVLVEAADRADGQVADRCPSRLRRPRAASAQQLLVRGLARRHRAVVAVEVRRRVRRRQAGGAAAHRVADDVGHRVDLGGRGRALGALVTHHPAADVGVADVAREVDAELPACGSQVLGERLEVPRDRAHRGRAASARPWRTARATKSRSRGRLGAIENPQLPASTVVTPWYDDIVANGSNVICGS